MPHMEIGLIRKKWKVFGVEGADDERLAGIVRNVKASMGNWEDHATGLFALNRVSIFAASDNQL